MLGGADIQVSAIKLAREMGYYVITCDYLPGNPGHRFSHEYHNVSTTDKEAVLALAKQLNPDGVVAYASDPAALTAAYVCEAMKLPTNPCHVVELYSRKDLFRDFLLKNDFHVPAFRACFSYEEAKEFAGAQQRKLVIKPVDSSGSKGVFVIRPNEGFQQRFEEAMSFTRSGVVIVEEFIEKKGKQIGGDGFVVNGKLVFHSFGDIHFSRTNSVLPCSVSLPASHDDETILNVHREVQRCLEVSGLKCGALNFDIMVDVEGRVFILEIGPRNGGNMIPELVNFRTGVDMKVYTLKTALGEDCSDLSQVEGTGYYSHYVIHAQEDGIVKDVRKSDELLSRLLYIHENFKPGDKVQKFRSSANRLGIMLLKYRSRTDMESFIASMHEHYKIEFE